MSSLLPFDVFIGLGANLGNPARQLAHAIASLQNLPHSQLHAVSRLYRTRPVGGPPGQPDYCNAAVWLQTTLTPHQLLAACQAIEQAAGRVRLEHWGPRVLDLDVLLYAKDCIHTPELRVPHPELTRRAFVILPLLDLQPALTLPDGQKIATLQAATDRDGITVSADADWWTSLLAE